jgi:NAD(P)-dependent dehydrogenase (short-subunit alcohol dehydrogenase family)
MIAKGFVSAGANVLLTSRDEQACQQAAQELQCHYVASNVSNRQGCEALAKHVATVFDNQLHVLVNNAGTSWGEPLDRDSGKMNWGWDKVMDLNVKGMFYLTRACIPLLQQKQPDTTSSTAPCEDPGRVINIGSVAGMIPQSVPTHAYDVSKAAVHHLTKKLAGDLAPHGITVNCVAPGYVETRMSLGLAAWGADSDQLARGIPLHRMGHEDDMAGACLYFSSKAGSWCTGVILNVDGGQVGALQLPVSSDL